MSQTTFPFAPEQQLEPEAEGGEAASRRPTLLVIGGAVAAVVLGIAAWLLFFSGGDADTAAPVVTKKVLGGAAQPAPSVKPVPVPLPAAFEGTTGRNPFKPLVSTAAPAEAPSNRPITPVGPVAPVGQPPIVNVPPAAPPVVNVPPAAPPVVNVPPAAPPVTAPTTPPPPPAATVVVTLMSVSADSKKAVIQVGTKKYSLTADADGVPFATNFVLLNLSEAKYATIKYGDVNYPLTLGQPLVLS